MYLLTKFRFPDADDWHDTSIFYDTKYPEYFHWDTYAELLLREGLPEMDMEIEWAYEDNI